MHWDDIRAAYPGCQIDFLAAGDTQGYWDARRLQQLLANLVVNAIKYGNSGSPVQVTMTGDADGVRMEVSNTGVPIDPLKLDSLFDPLTRGACVSGERSLGLGLYIAREIAKAHRGDIEARSDGAETTFNGAPSTPVATAFWSCFYCFESICFSCTRTRSA